MPKKQSTEVSVQMSDATLELLKQSFPVETSFQRILLPRIGMYSQDQVEGKGKAMKVTAEAGTFFVQNQTEELDENGKKKWATEEIGTETEIIIYYFRKQLKFYDGEKFTSSSVFDLDDEIIPLFKDKQEVDRGTPSELKSREIYKGKSAKGKDISKLEENRVLYVLYKGQPYQMNLRGGSMYNFLTFKKNTIVPSVLIKLGSDPKENGSIVWSNITFEVVRKLNEDEAREVLLNVKEIENSIKQEKSFFANSKPQTDEEKSNAKEVAEFNRK